ncbi:MAG: D-alanine--D-alanine ligase A [Holosporales bacterium]
MKKNVLIVFGGKSPEHEISVKTAFNVSCALDPDRYCVKLVGITRDGAFVETTPAALETLANNHKALLLDDTSQKTDAKELSILNPSCTIDVVIPLVHGVQGEDGCLQGFLQMLNVPYVGCNVKASAICMDKDVAKRILKTHSIPVVDWITLKQGMPIPYATIETDFGYPVFVKAAEQGSSVGTYKATSRAELEDGVRKAFEYGPKVIIEKQIVGREIECAILGNGTDLIASPLGEVVPSKKHGFYSYDAKYMDPDGADLVVGVHLPKILHDKITQAAKDVYTALDCSGFSRIDFFVCDDGAFYLNEVNTIPGFTSISMYPALMMSCGFTYAGLIEKLIDLGIESYHLNQSYKQV